MKFEDITSTTIRDVSDQELLSLHHRAHQLWPETKSREALIEAHRLLVDEMLRRDMAHNAVGEIDDTLKRSQYTDDYFAGLSEPTLPFVTELAEIARGFEGEEILEVGCGVGRALKTLSTSGLSASGVEVSDAAIKRCVDSGHKVEKGDATALPFGDGSFDVVFSMHVLEHVPDFAKALDESVRVARIKAVHLIPLGERKDATHEHEFPKLESLREKVLASTAHRPVSFRRLPGDVAIVTLDKGLKVSAGDLLAYLPGGDDLVVSPDFIDLVGGSVKSDAPADYDVLFRSDTPFMGAELRLRNLLPKDGDLREKLHFVYNAAGPHDDHLPLYDLVLRPKKLATVEVSSKARTLKPLGYFTPLKTAGGYSQQEFFVPDVFWNQWAKAFIEEGQKLDVEKKLNGWRGPLEIDDAGKALIFFEDTRTNRAAQFPGLVSDLKAIGKAAILDCDIGAVHANGEPVARRYLAGWNKKEAVAEDGSFEIATGEKVHLVVTAFDLLYLGSDSLIDLPWEERRKALEDLAGAIDFRFIKIVDKNIVSSKAQLLAAIRKVSKLLGSEGAVVKVVTSKYPLGGQTSEWSKVKNFVEFKVEITEVHPVEGGGRNFTVAYLDGGELVTLGKTFNTELDAKIGDVITIEASEIVPEKKGEKWRISAVVPRVLKPTPTDRPEAIGSILRRAHESGTLQVSPETLAGLRKDGALDVSKSESLDFLLCGKCASASPIEDGVDECPTCGVALDRGVVFKAAEGSLDFKEGDKGTGILQLHERGLSEEQTKLDRFFGWDPVVPTAEQLSRLAELHSADWSSLVRTASEGDSKPLANALKKIDREKLSASDRKLIALVDPVSVHTDFRLRPEGENYFEGGEGFTPGNQFTSNKLREIASGKLPETAKVLGNFKVPHKGEGASPGSIRGPIAWMTIGDKSPESFPPGSVGSTTGAWSRLKIVDKFKWRAGVQDPHFKEFEFDGDVLKGRWIFQYVPVGDGRREWMISRPKDQQLKADAKTEDAEKRVFIIEIVKAEKKLVTGVVLQPEIPDAQGDVYSEEVVEAAAHRFMESYLARKAVLGVQHKDYKRDLDLVESYIAAADMIVHGNSVKAGSWLMTIKVNDDAIWKRVKSGELTGLSIKGKVRAIKA